MAKVSIIVPAYNESLRIKKCIDSLLSQTYKDIEILVIDDGSTDSTVAILEEYHDDRLKVISKPNGGQGSARNVGIKKANGEYTNYFTEGNKIIFETRDNDVIYYIRDEEGSLIGLKYNNMIYYYIKNIQEDIIGLMDSNYNLVCSYEYDSWGKIISIEDKDGNKITDENNNERNEFYPNESFKVLVPIKDMKESTAFNLKAQAKVKTKPVYYGKTQKPGTQDYAITTNPYEDGTGFITEEYNKNETKLIILKKDQDSGNKLENVEFELLDENKQTIYTDLKTDKDGKIVIENLLPGVYYLKETNSTDGYEAYPELIEIKLELNQEMTVTVNNKKEEKPEVETKKTADKEVKTKEVKKLPVAGM